MRYMLNYLLTRTSAVHLDLNAHRNVSGTRVLCSGKQQTIAGITFDNYGCHTAGYGHPYVNAAAAIGGSQDEVDVFISRLVKTYRQLQNKWAAAVETTAVPYKQG